MDKIKSYTQAIQKLKEAGISDFDKLSSIEADLILHTLEYLASTIPVEKGKFQVEEGLTHTLGELARQMVSAITANNDYQSLVRRYLSNMQLIGENMIDFQESVNGIDVEKAGLNAVQKAVTNEMINQFTENGLNVGFAEPLRDIMYRNILAGMNLSEAKEHLQEYISGGKDQTGKLSQYLTQTAQMGVDAYSGAINTKLRLTFDYTGFIMSGSLIVTSSKQCVMGIEQAKKNSPPGYLSDAEIEALMQVARENKAARLIPGTTLDNLDINKFHWGCRHDFTPYIHK